MPTTKRSFLHVLDGNRAPFAGRVADDEAWRSPAAQQGRSPTAILTKTAPSSREAPETTAFAGESVKAALKSGILQLVRRAGYDIVKLPPPNKQETAPTSLFFVTMPKSGSVFITRALAQTLSLSMLKASAGYFPSDNIDLASMMKFQEGGYIAQTHIDPSPFNLSILSRFAASWSVHLRDPRAALLSWTFHLDSPRVYKNPLLALCVFPATPSWYYTDLTFTQKLDWQIANYYPALVAWIDRWCDVISDPAYAGKIRVTAYEDLVGREAAFIEAFISKTWRIAASKIELPPRNSSNHFRNGAVDEWRRVFTPQQIDKTTAMISPRAREMFGWGL